MSACSIYHFNFCMFNRSCVADATFSNALTNEISDEKERMVTIPVPSKGWSLKQKGTSCQLTKEFHNEW